MCLHGECRLQRNEAIGQLQVRACMRSRSAWDCGLQLQRWSRFKEALANTRGVDDWDRMLSAFAVIALAIPAFSSLYAREFNHSGCAHAAKIKFPTDRSALRLLSGTGARTSGRFIRPPIHKTESGALCLISAAASTRPPSPLVREAWVPIGIGGIATVPSTKRICQALRARQGQDPRRDGISVAVIGPHLA